MTLARLLEPPSQPIASLRPYQMECDLLLPPSEIPRMTLDQARSPLLAADAGPNGLHHIRQSLELNQINSPDFGNDPHAPLPVRLPPTANPTPSPPCYQGLPTRPPDLRQPTPSRTSGLPPAPVPEATLPSCRKLSLRRGQGFLVLTTG
ncbi:hypothetical protein M407DRAFT_28192 [Tulasnella calospora MUT 4182]|uniref:Uncharacterized protein n=1 Tax=Tulasnella calospora MUT 4182 TaxID=1051891 RepID=A0A0C3KLR7_9AGAM|nr:hypothetical protein M407DRAFT_28192 [Tulasnella calospora MUT 4182]